jgi:NAD+ synthase
MKFNVEKATEGIIKWIQNWFDKNGKGCNAVIGISGGKDSTVCAGLLVKALGKDRVIGVLMPNGEQADIADSHKVVNFLDIKYYTINIQEAYDSILKYMNFHDGLNVSRQTEENLPPRLRMSTLYAVSQSVNGRVCNTCNLSEDWVGYSTRYGDSVGDFSPLSNYTVTEVKEIGHYLGLPTELVDKTPIDGLCGKSDEENLGFTYAELDQYIRNGILPSHKIKKIIDDKHIKNAFKLQLMQSAPNFGYPDTLNYD